jgi:CTP:molybdopterin cytidylyltransferase MocA
MRFAVVVLAAGEGTRFGGHKLLAQLEGSPILQHVLDAIAVAGPSATVVVLGADAEDIERAIEWRDEQRVVNPEPGKGLSSSLKLGIAAVEAVADDGIEAILVALGDQPRTLTAVIHTLVEAETDRPIVVPRYSEDGARNPVLLHRDAWPLAARATGDRGLGAFIDAHRDLVLELHVAGSNPDVDTRADLAALAAEEDPATPAGA